MSVMRMSAGIARALKLPQAAAQGLDLLLVGMALPLKILQRFQNLVHMLEALL
jgi:hypothetical protein